MLFFLRLSKFSWGHSFYEVNECVLSPRLRNSALLWLMASPLQNPHHPLPDMQDHRGGTEDAGPDHRRNGDGKGRAAQREGSVYSPRLDVHHRTLLTPHRLWKSDRELDPNYQAASDELIENPNHQGNMWAAPARRRAQEEDDEESSDDGEEEAEVSQTIGRGDLPLSEDEEGEDERREREQVERELVGGVDGLRVADV